MSNVVPPTNSAGMVTLFEQRPYWHCRVHDVDVDQDMDSFSICWDCYREESRDIKKKERAARIEELREALRPLMEEAK